MTNFQLFEALDAEDQKKAAYFLKLLLQQSKYQKTKLKLKERREEVEQGETITHQQIWSGLGV